jgi:hypothetical protein
MALSIISTTGFSNGLSASVRAAGQSDPDHAASQTGAVASEDAAPSTRESATERPVRETQQASRLTPEEEKQLTELKQRDREVKAHELAHRAAAGRYVTGGSFTYQTGPDGQRYAIGGEVSVDTSSGQTPEETLRKAELIRRAALAPSEPSSQDYRVAAEAAKMATEARAEIRSQQRLDAQATKSDPAQEQTGAVSPLGRRAIASFTAIGGGDSLRSEPDTIDEII